MKEQTTELITELYEKGLTVEKLRYFFKLRKMDDKFIEIAKAEVDDVAAPDSWYAWTGYELAIDSNYLKTIYRPNPQRQKTQMMRVWLEVLDGQTFNSQREKRFIQRIYG